MELKLTKGQIKLIKERLTENINEEKRLRIKDKVTDSVSGWSFIHLLNERSELELVIKNEFIEL